MFPSDVTLDSYTDSDGNVLFTVEDFKGIQNKYTRVHSQNINPISIDKYTGVLHALGCSIGIFNVGGRLMLSGQGIVDIESLPSGIYFAKASQPGNAPTLLKFFR